MISVQHNMAAMNVNRQFNMVTKSASKSTEKLSSGYKINRAADDAAGLAISENMRRRIRGLNQGIDNTMDGISLCQVADGALDEVHDMLHRITELSVKAANGTNTQQDREAIQQEVTHLLLEIDRIGDETTFNEIPIFKGVDTPLYNPDGTPAVEGSIPFSSFKLVDLTLGKTPFNQNSDLNYLQLRAIVDNEQLAFHGSDYNLIFGNGSTSHSSIRLTYLGATGEEKTIEVPFSTLRSSNYQQDVDSNPPSWTRDFMYENDEGVEITVTQKVTVNSSGSDEKYYGISYSVKNTGTVDVGLDFQFHVDTAYNNDDQCEGYFIDGQRVDKYCVYSKDDSKFTENQTNSNIHQGVPDSLSIINMDNALSFSEKISFNNNKPDSFSIGHYNSIHEWSYYDNLNSRLGSNAVRSDLGFSLLWHNDLAAQNGTIEYSFDYGIAAVETDDNLRGVPLKMNTTQFMSHDGDKTLWIQSGGEPADGLLLHLGEMNTTALGIKWLDVSTLTGAEDALDAIPDAMEFISSYRSRVGAQQNRMEHTVDNEKNIVENTTNAESRIRDTDMAVMMVQFSKENILTQVGQAMLAQANQSRDGVLALLQ